MEGERRIKEGKRRIRRSQRRSSYKKKKKKERRKKGRRGSSKEGAGEEGTKNALFRPIPAVLPYHAHRGFKAVFGAKRGGEKTFVP